jgi:transcriptional regulator with XRE-family HTH domain
MTKFRDDELLKKFGKSLRDTRKSKGLSQEQLAFKANIPLNQVGRIERGEINTTISTVYLLSEILEVELKELFDF